MSIVVSDTSPLHYLILCDAVNVLPQLFAQVVIPPTVFHELQQPNTPPAVRRWAGSLPAWVEVRAPSTLDLTLNVDPGELEAISLAKEIKAAAILMDDRAGRNAALLSGLLVTGTIGVLEQAAARGFVQLTPALIKLQHTNARLNPELLEAALKREKTRQERERAQTSGRRHDPQR